MKQIEQPSYDSIDYDSIELSPIVLIVKYEGSFTESYVSYSIKSESISSTSLNISGNLAYIFFLFYLMNLIMPASFK